MRRRWVPQVSAGHVRLEDRRIERDAGHLVFALQPKWHVFQFVECAKASQAAAHVPNALAVERLAEQTEAAANLHAGNGIRFRPARRPDAAWRDRGKRPLVEFERLTILLELLFIAFRLRLQLQG